MVAAKPVDSKLFFCENCKIVQILAKNIPFPVRSWPFEIRTFIMAVSLDLISKILAKWTFSLFCTTKPKFPKNLKVQIFLNFQILWISFENQKLNRKNPISLTLSQIVNVEIWNWAQTSMLKFNVEVLKACQNQPFALVECLTTDMTWFRKPRTSCCVTRP